MVVAVEAVDVVDHLAAAVDAEVHVDIGHADALRVQEALEKEAVFDRVDVGDVQAVADDAARGAAAPGSDGDALSLGIADEVRDDQKIIHKAHPADHGQLIVELLVHLRPVGETLGEAPLAELLQIGKAVRLPGGEFEARQVVVAEFEVVAALVRDGGSHVGGLGMAWEQRAHLLLTLEVELLGLEAHAVGLVHGLAGLDAQQHVLGGGVGLFHIVGVVGDDEGDAGVAAELFEALGGLPLLGDAVILDLQIEVVAEECLQIQRAGFGRLIVAADQLLRDLAREAAGQAHQPLGVLVQQRPVDAGLVVEALGEAGADQIAEVAVAGLVFAQQDQVGVGVVEAVLLVMPGARGDVDLAADDGLDARGAAGLVEGHRPVHHAVVGDRQGTLPQFFGALRQLLDAAGAVEQRIFGMDVEMDEGHRITFLSA